MASDVFEDKRVIDLATQVTETTDRNVPILLLGLQSNYGILSVVILA